MSLNRPRAMRDVLALVVTAGVLVSCGGDSGSGPNPVATKPLTIVSGAGVTDSVSTRLLQALTVEVRENGVLRPGTVVRFETVPTQDSTRRTESPVVLSRLAANQFSTFLADSTDAAGRARALVQLGSIAGVARVAITVPELGIADTAAFIVLPGAATRLSITVRDTAVNVDASYSIGARVSDRFGNARASDVVNYTTSATILSVDATGRVKATGAGRARISVLAGSVVDSSKVSILPVASLAGVYFENGTKYIATMNLDGTGVRKLTTVSSSVMMPRWNPSSPKIVFYEGDPSYDSRVYVVNDQATRSQLIGTIAGVNAAFFPIYSADGQSLYFAASVANSFRASLWRANVDGSAPVRVVGSSTQSYTQPSPSPDGKRVVFTANGTISTLDLATSTVSSLGAQGDFPQYSPDGTRIVFTSGSGMTIMNADGTGARTLASRGYGLYYGMSWSSDGNWIIAGTYSGLELVRASDFEVLPLPHLRNFTQVSMK